jgi:hypothetical protein
MATQRSLVMNTAPNGGAGFAGPPVASPAPAGEEQRTPMVPAYSRLVDLILEEEHEERPPFPGLLAAGDLGRCPVQVAYRHRGVPKTSPPDAKTRRQWRYGKLLEEMVLRDYASRGLQIATQVHVYDPSLGVHGYIDQIVGGCYGGLSYPVTADEIKSTHSRSMMRLADEGPQASWMLQLACYKLAWDSREPCPCGASDWEWEGERPLKVEAWRVIGVGRDSQGELDWPLTDRWVRRALERIELLSRVIAGGKPECECPEAYGGKGPRYCEWADWSNVPGWEPGTRPLGWQTRMPLTCCGRTV